MGKKHRAMSMNSKYKAIIMLMRQLYNSNYAKATIVKWSQHFDFVTKSSVQCSVQCLVYSVQCLVYSV